MDKTDKQILELARPLFSEEAEELLIKVTKKLLGRVLKRQDDQADAFGKMLDHHKDMQKQLDDIQLQIDAIDTRTKQIKKAGDKTPEVVEEAIDKGMDKKQDQLLQAVDEQLENTPTKPFKKKKFSLKFWRR